MTVLLRAKALVSLYKNSKNCMDKSLILGKTPAVPGQRWDIEYMLPGKDCVRVPIVPIRTMLFRIRCCADHPLDGSGGFAAARNMAYDLPRLSTYHRHGFFRILTPLRADGVIFATLVTLSALAPQSVDHALT